MEPYDIVIIGGGIAGFTAAVRATEKGARTALVEKDRPGGQWIFNGRLPVRSVMQSLASSLNDKAFAEEAGFCGVGDWNVPRFLELARREANRVSGFWRSVLEKKNVALIEGMGRAVGPGVVLVDTSAGEENLRAGKIIIATGSDVREEPAMPFDGERVLSGDDFLQRDDLPEHLLLAGGGAEGCELATALRLLGRKVFVCEEEGRILSGHDKDLTGLMEDELRRIKIKLLLGKKILSIHKKREKVDVSLDGGVGFSVDGVWLCKKRAPRADSVKESGVRTGEYGEVWVDEGMRTSEDGIFAIGGVTRKWRNSALSQEEARVAVDNALGKDKALNPNRIPCHIHTVSELVSVGCFSGDAHRRGFGPGVEGVCDWREVSGKDFPSGMARVVADRVTRHVIGCHVMAPGAGAVLPSLMLALRKKWSVGDLAQFSNNLGTPFQMVGESARAALQLIKTVK